MAKAKHCRFEISLNRNLTPATIVKVTAITIKAMVKLRPHIKDNLQEINPSIEKYFDPHTGKGNTGDGIFYINFQTVAKGKEIDKLLKDTLPVLCKDLIAKGFEPEFVMGERLKSTKIYYPK